MTEEKGRATRVLGMSGGLLALLAALALVTGCGGTVIDSAKTEDALEANLKGSLQKDVRSVDCPSGVEVEKGATFRCTVKLAGGDEEIATLKVENENADVSVTDLRPANE